MYMLVAGCFTYEYMSHSNVAILPPNNCTRSDLRRPRMGACPQTPLANDVPMLFA